MNAMLDSMDTTEILDKAMAAKRLLKAPREMVFKAWSCPEALNNWWGPDGFSNTTKFFDFKGGGGWRFTMHGPDGRDYENRVNYDEIVPAERLRYHHGGEAGVEPVSFQVQVDFRTQGQNTLLTMSLQFPSNKQRDYVIENYGAFEGLKQTLGRLVEYLAKSAQCVGADGRDES